MRSLLYHGGANVEQDDAPLLITVATVERPSEMRHRRGRHCGERDAHGY
jgi:hypothetical protein